MSTDFLFASPQTSSGEIVKGDRWNYHLRRVNRSLPYYAVVSKEGSTTYAYKFNGDIIDDGVSGVEDGTVINSALNAINNVGGGRLFIKNATYDIETPLLVPALTIVDMESWSCILRCKASANVDVIRNRQFAVGTDEGIVIMNGQISGNKGSQSSTTIDVVSFNGALRAKIFNCLIKDSKRFGIRMVTNGVAVIQYNKLSANDSTQISMSSGSDDSVISYNDIGSGGAIGVNLNGVANCGVHHNNIFLNGTHGIDVTSSPRNTISHNRVHDNTQSGIRVTSAGSANSANLCSVNGNIVEGNNTGNSSSHAEILIAANAGIAHRGTAVTGNTIQCTGSNNTAIKEATGNVDFSSITGNTIHLISGTAITVIGAGTAQAGNVNFT